jgi:hypothetical protein
MDPTGAALIFGGVVALLCGPGLADRKRSGPTIVQPYDRIRPQWCYWLGVGLIVAGIVW